VFYIIQTKIEEISNNVYLRFTDCQELRDSLRKAHPSLALPSLNRGFFSLDSDLKSQESTCLQVQNFLTTLLNSQEVQQKPQQVLQHLGLPLNFFELPAILKQQ
jgi:hypothetical protein